MNKASFILGAPSMVYGENLAENIKHLSARLNHIEIVLFHTPDLHNIPDKDTIAMLTQLGAENNLTYSVHLPASLEIASGNPGKREASICLAMDCFHKTAVLNPINYVLHVPCTPPTLTAVPGAYFKTDQGSNWHQWTDLGLTGLAILEKELGWSKTLVVENINFSPTFLRPFIKSGFCHLCLDIGHLVLGRENICRTIENFSSDIQEIHLHGVSNDIDHIGLDHLPEHRVQQWIKTIENIGFSGVLNLEVFTADDLENSMAIVENAIQNHHRQHRRIQNISRVRASRRS